MKMPLIPDGYRIATEEEFKKLPKGTKSWDDFWGGWHDSKFVGFKGYSEELYIVPITEAPQPAADPKGDVGKTKCPLWLLPSKAIEETAWVLSLGASKYGPWNWRKNKVCASTYISAIMRHLNAWRDGQDTDDESGRSHLAHIAANCFILLDAMLSGNLIDDREKNV